MKNHIIVCKNCQVSVAKTPNNRCVNCKIPNWGYTFGELGAINTVNKPKIYKLTCKNCNTTVAKTPNEKCVQCGIPKWGYSDFEIKNSLVQQQASTSAAPSPSNSTTLITPPKQEGNQKYVRILVVFSLLVISLLLALSFLTNEATSSNQSINFETANSNEELAAAVAKITASNGAVGTGFLISPTKLLTAAHVVYGQDKVTVEFTKSSPRKTFTATVKHIGNVQNYRGLDFFLKDFALLQISKIDFIKPIAIGDSDETNELDEVITIGHSQGDPVLSFTDGKINSRKYGTDQVDLFKHSIPSNPGNSGGPIILKSTNEVVAILVGGRQVSVSGDQLNIPQGENIGVKINNIKVNLDEFDLER